MTRDWAGSDYPDGSSALGGSRGLGELADGEIFEAELDGFADTDCGAVPAVANDSSYCIVTEHGHGGSEAVAAEALEVTVEHNDTSHTDTDVVETPPMATTLRFMTHNPAPAVSPISELVGLVDRLTQRIGKLEAEKAEALAIAHRIADQRDWYGRELSLAAEAIRSSNANVRSLHQALESVFDAVVDVSTSPLAVPVRGRLRAILAV